MPLQGTGQIIALYPRDLRPQGGASCHLRPFISFRACHESTGDTHFCRFHVFSRVLIDSESLYQLPTQADAGRRVARIHDYSQL
jgi:hypothetical protein